MSKLMSSLIAASMIGAFSLSAVAADAAPTAEKPAAAPTAEKPAAAPHKATKKHRVTAKKHEEKKAEAAAPEADKK
ncbi:MAG: hypothetical protein ACUVSD_12005 [Thiobacillaceae bacterium]